MIRNRVTIVQMGVAGMLAMLAGSAVPAADAAKPSFEALDKNSDGKVSLNEAADNDALFVAFKGLDTNKDGMLSREEFAAFQKDKPPA
jgi:Ca2+-binding EF-hand superfamily protein